MSVSVATNVIPVDFGKSAPVLTSFAEASRPKGEIAVRLAAEASQQLDKLTTDKRAGLLKTLATLRGDRFSLNPYLISIKDGWNSRVANDPANIEHIDNLAQSIAREGVLVPLTVFTENGKVFVTDGHCRLLATFRAIEVYDAEIKSVQVVTDTSTSEAERLINNQIVRNGAKPLTVLEQGSVFARLVKFGWSSAQIAEKTLPKISAVRVSQILDLMANANDGIKVLVASGRISASQAAQTLRDTGGDADAAEKLLNSAVNVAAAAGKTRATAKHVSNEGVIKVSTKLAVRAILSAKTTKVETIGKTTTVTLPATQWAEVARLLNVA